MHFHRVTLSAASYQTCRIYVLGKHHEFVCEALVKTERSVGLTLTDVPKPAIGPNDVLIEVTKSLRWHHSQSRAGLSTFPCHETQTILNRIDTSSLGET